MTIRFDDALDHAIEILKAHLSTLSGSGGGKTLLVRDLFGRLRLAQEHRTENINCVEEELGTKLGVFFAGPSLVADEMVAPKSIFGTNTQETLVIRGIEVLERVLVGAEWTKGLLPNSPPRPPRAALYGIKGGVGRSTAIVAWAQHLASLDERVLVVDLDLESPGISSSLLPPSSTSFGVVDWLVENAVGQADDELLRLMVASSPLPRDRGEILVAPCGASTSSSYIAKLARSYLEIPSQDGPQPLAARIANLLDHLERVHQPTIVLLDSRAGLHDLAGITTTRLGAVTFLFAANTTQTWAGYRTLLSEWASRPRIAREIRERLHVVAAQVPETGRGPYLERLRVEAYDAFEPLYDRPPSEGQQEATDAFNPDIQASDAPHTPLPIYWSGEFQSWDPLNSEVTPDQMRGAFGAFCAAATDILLAERGAE